MEEVGSQERVDTQKSGQKKSVSSHKVELWLLCFSHKGIVPLICSIVSPPLAFIKTNKLNENYINQRENLMDEYVIKTVLLVEVYYLNAKKTV